MRQELVPYEGKLLFLSGVFNRIDHRGDRPRRDIMLSSVRGEVYNPHRRINRKNRLIQTDHLWVSLSKDMFDRFLRNKIYTRQIFFGKVTRYTRVDGSEDLGIECLTEFWKFDNILDSLKDPELGEEIRKEDPLVDHILSSTKNLQLFLEEISGVDLNEHPLFTSKKRTPFEVYYETIRYVTSEIETRKRTSEMVQSILHQKLVEMKKGIPFLVEGPSPLLTPQRSQVDLLLSDQRGELILR